MAAALRSPADFQFEFGRDSVRLFSLFGEAEVDYPPGYIIAANQTDARPAWGAWAPDILGLAAIGTFLGAAAGLGAAGHGLFPAGLADLFVQQPRPELSRQLEARRRGPHARRLAAVARRWCSTTWADLTWCSCVSPGLHLVIGWIYLFVSPLFLNRARPAEKKNPFAS